MLTFLEFLRERSWSSKYKRSINCDRPKGFSQRAHCAGRKKRLKEASTRVVRRLPRSWNQLTVVSPTLYRIGPDTAPVLEVGYDPRHGWRWYGVTPYKQINTYHGAWHATKDEAIRELDLALVMKQVPLVNVHSAAAGTRKLQRRQP